jgi:hypothetical protein
MSQRAKYHVTPKGDQWQVKKEGAERANKLFDNKADALDKGRDLAKHAELGQLIIHKQTGTFQTEHTYGKDPYPPEG